jgi:hypothetical protein
MSELARVEGEQQGTLCLVRVHGEVDLSNAHQVSSAIAPPRDLPPERGAFSRWAGRTG